MSYGGGTGRAPEPGGQPVRPPAAIETIALAKRNNYRCFVSRETEDSAAGRSGPTNSWKAWPSPFDIAPIEVLTNGRQHIRNHFEALRRLNERHGGRLTLRITIESPDAQSHDAIRERGTFAQTTETLRLLA